MSTGFLVVITILWGGAAVAAGSGKEWGNCIMYSGFALAQLGMILNAVH